MRLTVVQSFGLGILIWFVLSYMGAVVWFLVTGEHAIAAVLLAFPLVVKLGWRAWRVVS